MANKETPTEDVLRLMKQGTSDSEIIRSLSERGYSPVQITDALNQARIKKEISKEEGLEPSIMQTEAAAAPKAAVLPSVPAPVPAAPSIEIPRPAAVPTPGAMAPSPIGPIEVTTEYPAYPYEYPTAPPSEGMGTEAIEEIAEEIVNEKWLEIKGKVSDVIEWKTYAEKRITSVDERIKRIEGSLDRLQAALLSKVQEYGRNIKDLGAEMSALEGAFGKILSPFVENMRELSKITGDLKKVSEKKIPKMKIPKIPKIPDMPKKIVVKPEVKVVPKIVKEKPAVKKTVHKIHKKPGKKKTKKPKVVKEVRMVTRTYKK